ncbi:hypothetical protein HELRODRAFT_67815, partial [Helobdella robusta]|uniref:PIH1 domain-containing protein 1 n=1 Tax=Helobdella robusta TaxID=6412 RepID=T1FZ57_HELRO
GFCMKTKDSQNKKVFINVCKCNNIPRPKDITDEEIVTLLASDDPTTFRVPLSLGEPHLETDNCGSTCTAYDVMINSSFFANIQSRECLKSFFFNIVVSGLEDKFNIELDKDIIILKNKKFMGTLSPQNVRTQSKPWIMEMDETNNKDESVRPLLLLLVITPKYTIIQEPSEGLPEYLVGEFRLPDIKMASSLSLDIGEDRLVLGTRSGLYHLDIYLPYNLDQSSCTAQFNRKTNVGFVFNKIFIPRSYTIHN